MDNHFQLFQENISSTKPFTKVKIVEMIIELIQTGELIPGTKIPSLREMAQLLSVTISTVHKSYKQLQDEKYLKVLPADGTYINDILPCESEIYHPIWPIKAPYTFREQDPFYGGTGTTGSLPYISAGSDIPDISILSIEKFVNYYRSRKNQYNKNVSVHAEYPEMISAEIHKILIKRDILVLPEQCLPVPYGFALYLVASMLIVCGENVVMTSASDLQAQRIFLMVGAQLVYTGIDDEGMLISELEKLCTERQVKAVFLRPAADVPFNVVLSEPRRQALIKLSIKHHFVIIAYDENREFWFQKELAPLINRRHEGHVIYVSPVSKISGQFKSHELIVATTDFIEMLTRIMRAHKIILDPVYFLAMCLLINSGEIEVELRKVMRYYRKLRKSIHDYFNTYLSSTCQITLPSAGLALWITFKKGREAGKLQSLLQEHGLMNVMCSIENLQQPIYGLHLGFGSQLSSSWEELFKTMAMIL